MHQMHQSLNRAKGMFNVILKKVAIFFFFFFSRKTRDNNIYKFVNQNSNKSVYTDVFFFGSMGVVD